MSNHQVSIIKCNDYSKHQVEAAVSALLEYLGGIEKYVKPSQKVLLKPNILSGSPPEKAAATHPEVIRALIRQVKKAGGIPLVGDSPGFEAPRRAAQGSGILKVVEEEGATLVGFNQGKEVSFKEGIACKKMTIVIDVLSADVIVNVAKLKSHGYSGITAAVKNTFGCMPGLVKSQFHLKYPLKNDFDMMLLDVFRMVKPTLNIVDAVVAQEGEGGPITGAPRAMNLMIAGEDGVAVDSICAVLTGKQPRDFNFLKLAAQHQIGETDLNKIEILGEKLEANIAKDFNHIQILKDEMLPGWIPASIITMARRMMLDRPRLIRKKCTKCGVCCKVCAAKAITLIGGRPKFNYNKCIGCFCCQEMCKFGAINIKKSLLAKIVFKISSIFSKFP